MNNILYILIAVWFLYEIANSIKKTFSEKRVLTVEKMADNVTMGLSPDGNEITPEYLKTLDKDSLLMNHFRAQSEAAEKVIRQRSTGEVIDGRNLAKKKRTRGRWL